MARLELRDAEVTFRAHGAQRPALFATTLIIDPACPSVTAVVGESGSGKTTLIRLLLGFQAPTAGEVLYDGAPVGSLSGERRKRFRRDVQAIFQDPFDSFNPFYKVDHALFAPLKAFGLAPDHTAARARIEAALESVGLSASRTLGKYPHQLSGGQRQRVMIARALLLEPKIILADEPVSMVDASLRSQILEILHRLNRKQGIALVYVTHDLTTAYQVADTVLVLNAGRVVEVGETEAVIGDPRHPYTRALLEAVPSPDPDVPWRMSDVAPAAPPAVAGERLRRTEPLRAVLGLPEGAGEVVTVADIQRAVSDGVGRTPA